MTPDFCIRAESVPQSSAVSLSIGMIRSLNDELKVASQAVNSLLFFPASSRFIPFRISPMLSTLRNRLSSGSTAMAPVLRELPR